MARAQGVSKTDMRYSPVMQLRALEFRVEMDLGFRFGVLPFRDPGVSPYCKGFMN